MAVQHFDLRTGVIGVGSMGQNHARVYSEISNLVGVADADREQADRIAKRFGVQAYTDYHQLLEQVDAVTIAVPTVLHQEVALAAAAAGVHQLVEKPLAPSLEACQAIIDAAHDSGVVLSVGHIERHNPVVTFAKEALKRGDWGQLISLSARRVSNFPARITDVGVIFDMSIHDLDILRYMAATEIRSIYALGGKQEGRKHEDHASILVEFDDHCQGYIEVNWLTPMKVRELTLTCSSHYVTLDYIEQRASISTSQFGDIDTANLFQVPLEIEKREVAMSRCEPLKNELTDLLTAATTDRPPLVTGQDGYGAVQAAQAAIKSLKERQKVVLLE